MRKIFFLVLIFAGAMNSYGQTPILIKGRGYKGAILVPDSAHRSDVLVLNDTGFSVERYVLSIEQIKWADRGLKSKIKAAMIRENYSTKWELGCPVPYKNLRRYYRKYSGLVNPNTNEKFMIIYFQLKRTATRKDRLKNDDFRHLDDGCTENFRLILNGRQEIIQYNND